MANTLHWFSHLLAITAVHQELSDLQKLIRTTEETHVLAPAAEGSQQLCQVLEDIQLDSSAAQPPDDVCGLLWVYGVTEQSPGQKHWSMM